MKRPRCAVVCEWPLAAARVDAGEQKESKEEALKQPGMPPAPATRARRRPRHRCLTRNEVTHAQLRSLGAKRGGALHIFM